MAVVQSSAAPSKCREAMRAPSAARLRASCRPMPLAAPVIKATRLRNDSMLPPLGEPRRAPERVAANPNPPTTHTRAASGQCAPRRRRSRYHARQRLRRGIPADLGRAIDVRRHTRRLDHQKTRGDTGRHPAPEHRRSHFPATDENENVRHRCIAQGGLPRSGLADRIDHRRGDRLSGRFAAPHDKLKRRIKTLALR